MQWLGARGRRPRAQGVAAGPDEQVSPRSVLVLPESLLSREGSKRRRTLSRALTTGFRPGAPKGDTCSSPFRLHPLAIPPVILARRPDVGYKPTVRAGHGTADARPHSAS